MRLHSLELRAIGPFATRQHVDFDDLTASGLFLLDGPTGAGKTTVLDAITFALYGPGERGGDDRLRSDFAPAGTEPRVCLQFSVRGVRHRITRTPEFDRPKRRGEGTTRQAASAHLERFANGQWASRSSNKAEIAEMLADEIGLTRDQFGQVVLLPQGEFARFLRSSDDDRRALLTRLFGTELYDRITDEFDRRRQEASRELDAAFARVADCVAAAAEAAGLDAEGRRELSALSAAERVRRFDDIAAALTRRCETADAELALADSSAQSARSACEAVSAEASAIERFATAQAELADHLAAGDQVEAARGRVAAAVRAEPVRPLTAVLERATAAAASAQAAAPVQSVADIEKGIERAKASIEARVQATERAASMQQQLSAARRAETLRPKLAEAGAACDGAVKRHQASVDEHQRLVEARLSGMAAELAGKLREGDPCPVCGSPAHPAPAPVADGAVGAAEVRAAQARREQSEDKRRAAEQLVAEIEQSLDAALETAGDTTVAELTAELAELEAILSAGNAAVREEKRLRRSLALATQAQAAAAALSDALAHAESEAAAAGFDSVEGAAAAVLTPAERADLERRVNAWDTKATALRVALDAADFAPYLGLSHDEIAARRQHVVQLATDAVDAATEAERLRTAALAEADRAHRAAERLHERRAELAAADREHSRLAAEAAPVLHLSKLTKGMAGQRRVALTTYVLRHWFEQVVQAANVRLAAISSGRYELMRVDEGGTRNERAGLTLQVVDRHTGEARSPRSLSGGETFYTSLALALGLADVVKAEAGGVDLDTLFIDEGFGTLDSDTLDQVMAVIDDLRDRGRIVGVVSHVAELKDRIPERLEVRRLPDGSSALRVVA